MDIDCKINESDMLTSNSANTHAYTVLNSAHLAQDIQSMLSLHKRQHNRTKSHIPCYLSIDVLENAFDHSRNVQRVLGVHDNILIYSNYPNRVYWNGGIFKSIGRTNNNFQCHVLGCKATIAYCAADNGYHTQKTFAHKSNDCMNSINRFQLVHHLLKQEMYYNISHEPSPQDITPRMHYDRIIQKYDRSMPLMDLCHFPPFHAIESSLYKKKPITYKLTATGCKQFFDTEFDRVMNAFARSKSMRNQVKDKIFYEVDKDNVLLTRKELLILFFESAAVGGDGTFNIRPVFLRLEGGRFKQHEQVYKIYAYRTYQSKSGDIITMCYLIAVALLTSTDASVYVWMYKTLAMWYEQLGLINNQQIQQFVHDFERAARNAFRNIIAKGLDVVISGEYFHYSKTIQKNVVQKGLSIYYVNKKNSKHYDSIFRKHIELIYNLAYVPSGVVQSFAKLIVKSMWSNIKAQKKYKGSKKEPFVMFIVYYLVCYCEIKKSDISDILRLRGKQRKWVSKRQTTKFLNISEWNLYGKKITNSNAIEVNNKHDRHKLGYYPNIYRFTLFYMRKFDDVIRTYNSHQEQGCLSNKFVSTKVKEKTKLLKQSIGQTFTFPYFLELSAKLTEVKYKNKGKSTSTYFVSQFEIDDDIPFNDTSFNKDILAWYQQYNKAATLSITATSCRNINNIIEESDSSVESSEEDFAPIYDNDQYDIKTDDKINTNNKRKTPPQGVTPPTKRRKLPRRKVRIEYEESTYNPYQEYSSTDEQGKWISNMKRKIVYDKSKKNTLFRM